MQVDRLAASDGVVNDGFGASVAIRTRVIVVGAPRADLGLDEEGVGPLLGNAYVFLPSRYGWYESQKINDATDNFPTVGIGVDVAIGNGLLALTASGNTGRIRDVDRVFVYDWVDGQFQFERKVVEFEGTIPDIDMAGRELIASTHIQPVFTYFVLGDARILVFGRSAQDLTAPASEP
jgi:hypothetical protein